MSDTDKIILALEITLAFSVVLNAAMTTGALYLGIWIGRQRGNSPNPTVSPNP